MKKYLLNLVLVLLVTAILIATGINAVSGQVTVEEKQSSFKLTDFDYLIRTPSFDQIEALEGNTEAIKSVFACYEFEVNCTSDRTSPKLRVLFSDDMDDYGIGLFTEKTLLSGAFDKSGLMLDEKAAEKLRVSVGDTVRLALKGTSVSLEVAAIYRASTYDSLDDGLALAAFTDEIKALYLPTVFKYSHAFIEANDEALCASALSGYKPLGYVKTKDEFIKDPPISRRPMMSDAEWQAALDSAYTSYYDETVSALKTEGNLEKKSDHMADVAERIETTQHKVDLLTVGIAIASAVIFALVSVAILYLNRANDVLLAKEGAEKSHMLREKLVVNTLCPAIASLATFASLAAVASGKGFLNETLGVILLCSLPVLASIIPTAIVSKIYVDGIFGKAEMQSGEDDIMVRVEDIPEGDEPASAVEGEIKALNADTEGGIPADIEVPADAKAPTDAEAPADAEIPTDAEVPTDAPAAPDEGEAPKVVIDDEPKKKVVSNSDLGIPEE